MVNVVFRESACGSISNNLAPNPFPLKRGQAEAEASHPNASTKTGGLPPRKVALDQRPSLNQLRPRIPYRVGGRAQPQTVGPGQIKTPVSKPGLSPWVTAPGLAAISMTGEQPISFVDTNILVYALDERSPKTTSREARQDSWMRTGSRLSNKVLQELFVTLTREIRADKFRPGSPSVLDDLSAWPLMVVDYTSHPSSRGFGRSSPNFVLGCTDRGRRLRTSTSVLYTRI